MLIDDFAPALGDRFDVLDWGTLVGAFDTVLLPALSEGLAWDDSQLYVDGTLSVVAGLLPGDYNTDGVIDAADYTVWRDNVGQPADTLPNDPTGEAIGTAQYNAWRRELRRQPAGAQPC